MREETQRREAAMWFVRIHDVKDPSPALLQSWMQWLNATEANRRAFEAVERVWHQAPADMEESFPEDAGEAADGHDEDDYDGSVSVAEWNRRRMAHVENAAVSDERKTSGKPVFRWVALAAAVAGIMTLGWWTVDQHWPLTRPSSGEFVTRTGEHMDLVLADGSRISLGAKSRLTVGFTQEARNVRLSSGEAFFTVRKDPYRPFKVHTFDRVITAVGTAFNVRANADRVTVAVAEGIVAVSDTKSPPPAVPSTAAAVTRPVEMTRLSQGEQLTFTARADIPSIETGALTRIDPDQSDRWREGWLVYRHEPLRYVIADVTRYSDIEIAVSDSVASELRFTGAVHEDSVSEWIAALPEVFPVAIESDGRVLRVTAAQSSMKVENGAR